jgi:chaperonin GroES
MKMLSDRVAIRRDVSETETPGGIVIPGGAEDKAITGTVVAVGPGLLNENSGERLPMNVAVGNRVLIGRYNGVEVELDGWELVIMDESEIMAVIE